MKSRVLVVGEWEGEGEGEEYDGVLIPHGYMTPSEDQWPLAHAAVWVWVEGWALGVELVVGRCGVGTLLKAVEGVALAGGLLGAVEGLPADGTDGLVF